MAVLKILGLFLLIGHFEKLVLCQSSEEFYDHVEEISEKTTFKIPTDNELTHVRTKNLSGNVKLTTLQVLTTITPLDKFNNQNEEEDILEAKPSSQNKQSEVQTIPENHSQVVLLSKLRTKAPTDGTESFTLMDVFNSTSGSLPDQAATEKLITVTALNFDRIRDSTTPVTIIYPEKNTEDSAAHDELQKFGANLTQSVDSKNSIENGTRTEVIFIDGISTPMTTDKAEEATVRFYGLEAFPTKSAASDVSDNIFTSTPSPDKATLTELVTKPKEMEIPLIFQQPITQYVNPSERVNSVADDVFTTTVNSESSMSTHFTPENNTYEKVTTSKHLEIYTVPPKTVAVTFTGKNLAVHTALNLDQSVENVEDLSAFIDVDEELLSTLSDKGGEEADPDETIEDVSLILKNYDDDVAGKKFELNGDKFRFGVPRREVSEEIYRTTSAKEKMYTESSTVNINRENLKMYHFENEDTLKNEHTLTSSLDGEDLSNEQGVTTELEAFDKYIRTDKPFSENNSNNKIATLASVDETSTSNYKVVEETTTNKVYDIFNLNYVTDANNQQKFDLNLETTEMATDRTWKAIFSEEFGKEVTTDFQLENHRKDIDEGDSDEDIFPNESVAVTAHAENSDDSRFTTTTTEKHEIDEDVSTTSSNLNKFVTMKNEEFEDSFVTTEAERYTTIINLSITNHFEKNEDMNTLTTIIQEIDDENITTTHQDFEQANYLTSTTEAARENNFTDSSDESTSTSTIISNLTKTEVSTTRFTNLREYIFDTTATKNFGQTSTRSDETTAENLFPQYEETSTSVSTSEDFEQTFGTKLTTEINLNEHTDFIDLSTIINRDLIQEFTTAGINTFGDIFNTTTAQEVVENKSKSTDSITTVTEEDIEAETESVSKNNLNNPILTTIEAEERTTIMIPESTTVKSSYGHNLQTDLMTVLAAGLNNLMKTLIDYDEVRSTFSEDGEETSNNEDTSFRSNDNEDESVSQAVELQTNEANTEDNIVSNVDHSSFTVEMKKSDSDNQELVSFSTEKFNSKENFVVPNSKDDITLSEKDIEEGAHNYNLHDKSARNQFSTKADSLVNFLHQEIQDFDTTAKNLSGEESKNDDKDPELSTTLEGENLHFSVKIAYNKTSFFIPSDAAVEVCSPNTLNITWESSTPDMNNSLEINLGHSVQLNIVKGAEIHIYKSALFSDPENKLDVDTKVIALDDGIRIYFSNIGVLKTDQGNRTAFRADALPSTPQQTEVLAAEIIGGCIGVFVVVGILVYCAIKKFGARIRNFKPNSETESV